MRLEGKVALISGGALGMGAAEARLFAREGARVVIGDVLEAEGRAVEADVRARGGEAVFTRLDVTSEADWQRAVDLALKHFGTLKVLINNAGIGGASRLEDTPVEAWDRVMDVNAKGVFLGSKPVIPAMRQAGGGAIVNISSQLGLVGMADSSPQYQASKGAVRLLTKLTALQYAKERIRANSVHPGPILTPMTEKRRADPATYRRTVSRIPLGRYGESDEVAYGVLYLASDESSFVTGSELVIDGGWTAQYEPNPAAGRMVGRQPSDARIAPVPPGGSPWILRASRPASLSTRQ
jgi:NAD(P)-dependent dehydrogenase (short-subunit alcohol dehydrogenase family)